MKTALILYPHQLFLGEYLPHVDRVYLVEEPLIFGTDKDHPLPVHKQKLVLHRASMRRYAREVLMPRNYDVSYVESADDLVTATALVKAVFDGASEVYVFDPVDTFIWERLALAASQLEAHVPLKKLPNPNFYLTEQDIEAFTRNKTKYKFSEFYQWQRERFNVLIDEHYKPLGGKWSHDADNRKKLPKGTVLPGIASFGDNDYVKEAVQYVEKKFPNNTGTTNNFIWPTNHEEARMWLKDFCQHRLRNFGPYEDAIVPGAVWLFHSALTPALNIGLLNAREVVEEVLDYAAGVKEPIPISSLEGFIRQVLGWREYVRCMYVVQGSKMRIKNVLGNTRLLTADWYDGTTGIDPVDDVIKKCLTHAYAHHIERLMVVGNFMLLCDIHPDAVYHWFMSFTVDAYDWVMVPNIYGMSQYADGGSMTTKPYMSASNYILTMSSYKKGQWSDVWDGLFWRFVDRHRELLRKNPRLGGILIKRFDTMDADRKRIIGYRAEDFLRQYTRN